MIGKSERIVLTGASGFIGSHLRSSLIKHGYEVHCILRKPAEELHNNVHLCDFKDFISLARILSDLHPDFVIHLASLAAPSRNIDSFDIHYENTVLPAIALSRAVSGPLKLLLFFGSCEEYGNGPCPFHEDQPLVGISPYGWAKISAFYAATQISKQRQLPWCWIRPFLAFGGLQKSNAFIPTLIRGCLSDVDIPLTLGEQTRDFIFIDDLCRMIVAILKGFTKAQGQILNLCSGTPRVIRVVAEMIQRKIGKGRLLFGALPYRENEAMSFFGCPDRFFRLYGPFLLTPFEEALHRTIDQILMD